MEYNKNRKTLSGLHILRRPCVVHRQQTEELNVFGQFGCNAEVIGRRHVQ
jgi:hypothetical protein